VIDLDREEVLQDGQPVRLTPVERSVLAMLVGNPGRVVTREALLLEVYGDNPRVDLRSRAVDVHLSNLRRKLGDPPYVETVAEVGLRASTPTAGQTAGTEDLDQVRQRRRQQRRAWARGAAAGPVTGGPSPARTSGRRPGR